jgi:hypothetical protein
MSRHVRRRHGRYGRTECVPLIPLQLGKARKRRHEHSRKAQNHPERSRQFSRSQQEDGEAHSFAPNRHRWPDLEIPIAAEG